MDNRLNIGNQNFQQDRESSNSHPVSPLEKPKNNYIVIVASILVCSVILGYGGYYFGKHSALYQNCFDQRQPKSSLIPSLMPISTPTNIITQVLLPVTILETTYGIDRPQTTYPLTITVSIPEAFKDQIAAYGVSEQVIIGPKGWTGRGGVGADGNISISLFPTNGSVNQGPRIIIFIASTGTGSALFEAAPYSLWLQSRGQEIGLAPIPKLVPGLHLTPITTFLSRYTLPSTADSLEVNGIVYSDAQDHIKDSMWAFTKIETVFPVDQRDLAMTLLDVFIGMKNLKN
jgi:hypothetical protein